MSYIKNPSSIEEKSFQIIQSVIDQDHPGYEFHEDMEEAIIKRAIHTTGDFDYLYTMKFINHVNERIVDVIQNKGTIIVDSSISLNGINKRVLDQMGVSYRCLINDEDVIQLAKEKTLLEQWLLLKKQQRSKGLKYLLLVVLRLLCSISLI
ncbi:cobalt-precorrin-8X methylmutase [Streptococcus australis ATCC 700641]|uniref:Cobalt-precorrin-8X methylmutase n=1 Tax=Streptococcus australis ATCC 700641 TaxID=888833 RepID=E7SAT0_9STRE|nr:cobalt-precorrin-8X methylmutase [Streptococcus australis ATCC 700641]EGU64845.1 putative cobalt-precorrin-8X methylmutase [Streptococcus australis ATCC 700641]